MTTTSAHPALLHILAEYCEHGVQPLGALEAVELDNLLRHFDVMRATLQWYADGNGAAPKGHCGDYGERARAALLPPKDTCKGCGTPLFSVEQGEWCSGCIRERSRTAKENRDAV
jgi:hypothetical protein